MLKGQFIEDMEDIMETYKSRFKNARLRKLHKKNGKSTVLH